MRPTVVDFGTSPVRVQLAAGLERKPIASRKVRLRALERQWTSAEATTDECGVAVIAEFARHPGTVVLDVHEAGAWASYEIEAERMAAQVLPRARHGLTVAMTVCP